MRIKDGIILINCRNSSSRGVEDRTAGWNRLQRLEYKKRNNESKQFNKIKKIITANEKKANKEYRTQNKIHKTSKTNKTNRYQSLKAIFNYNNYID